MKTHPDPLGKLDYRHGDELELDAWACILAFESLLTPAVPASTMFGGTVTRDGAVPIILTMEKSIRCHANSTLLVDSGPCVAV